MKRAAYVSSTAFCCMLSWVVGCGSGGAAAAGASGSQGVLDGGATRDAGFEIGGGDQRQPNYIFVTRDTYRGDSLGGPEGANALCTGAAHSAGLQGAYVALLFTGGVLVDLGDARGWVRPDGLAVADEAESLSQGRLWYPPILDEFGAEIPGDPPGSRTAHYWNGMWDDCSGWTGAGVGSRGQVGFLDSGLRAHFTRPCDTEASLTCVGVDRSASVAPNAVPSRLAFDAPFLVPSSPDADGLTGTALLDHSCNTEAEYQGFAGSFAAFVATTNAGALSRLPTGGSLPWSRPDGVMVLESWGVAHTRGLLFAPMSYGFSHHIPEQRGYYVVVTGAEVEDLSAPGTPETTCGDWTGLDIDGGSIGTGISGISTPVFYHRGGNFNQEHGNPCTVEYGVVVYCFQE